ncbi:MAG: ergothioneine biosynthesis protein EgtB [Planctomycetota bacterium]
MDRQALRQDFERVRAVSMRLAAPLQPEDWRVQSMPDVSPPYWNLGHTSWFFARNVLRPLGRDCGDFPGFDYAFNSYYEGLGPRLSRDRRGRVAQPGTAATLEYRRAVDAAVVAAIGDCAGEQFAALARGIGIGLQHEQQHQELLLTEILHIRWSAPSDLRLPYAAAIPAGEPAEPGPLRALDVAGGVVEIGHDGPGFCWDNELPRHRRVATDLALADRLVTNGEWLQFVADGGYDDPLLWLSNGWAAVQQHGWRAPLYWHRQDGAWTRFTLRGAVAVDPAAPVGHVSFYEAEAFARWYGLQFSGWRHARLPAEHEWEHAARTLGFATGHANLLDDEPARSALDVRRALPGTGARQLAGDVWEWTSSHYEPYPGYRPFDGALMEYNGKFMDNQRVLRGGSFATPRTHARVAYRNFWPAATRFQAAGVRLLLDR